ncbi:protein shisa-like-2A [Engraulis encrasicolus]|uniref:protein shisa-like-2A n=1 Tax=Engraulis encrasicolus TaxID=184585 RepID=UPI002FD75CCA
MTAVCSSYYNASNAFVNGFSCPKPENDARATFCCGFIDMKYCCDDPNSFFPYEYGYMWWLSVGALVGLSIAAVVLLAFLVTVCVLCYLFIVTKPTHPDSGLSLRALEPSAAQRPSEPPGVRRLFQSCKVDCDSQASSDPECLFQRCFTATVTRVNESAPS